MTLSALASELSAELTGADARVDSVSTDTRTLSPGQLYVALVGENFDGNRFVAQARAKGASAAIVSDTAEHGLPVLRVRDSSVALGQIGRLNRERSQAKVIALTGSQGKTTVKEMLGQILSISANPMVTKGNLNNAIGVPLTLLELTEQHDFAVVEMGANALGEIAYSVGLVQPDIGLITNAGSAHLEGFGSYQGIVSAKGEIIDGVKAQGAVVLNKNDQAFKHWHDRAGSKQVISFAVLTAEDTQAAAPDKAILQADYLASGIINDEPGQLTFQLAYPQQGRAKVVLSLLGKHNVANATAAAAVAMQTGVSIEDVVQGLARVKPVKGRLCSLPGCEDSRLIDDSYNASPGSFVAAIDVLAEFTGNKVLVVGDMKELGEGAAQAHRVVGEYAVDKKINAVWTVGEMSQLASLAAGNIGQHFPDQQALIKACRAIAGADTVFLIKGSRGAQMDKVVDGLIGSGQITGEKV